MGKRPTLTVADLPRSFVGWLWQRYDGDPERRFAPFVTRKGGTIASHNWFSTVQKMKAAGWVRAHLARSCVNDLCHHIDHYDSRQGVYHVRFTQLGVDELRVILTHLVMSGADWLTKEQWYHPSGRERLNPRRNWNRP